ncbi:hypothetical protein EXIGLDRAFT_515153 [Exidia glandulosa HHB12029]|uniref:Uncharacterized protein n=1 Tax=Exidia glandulosa HHB12029 TaxID=1314781 RepID=A0A165J8S3_EXIGL|nr:hypothetical protein EXIGLDRAFT_515153 [Exidia glandulosa HHB12029]
MRPTLRYRASIALVLRMRFPVDSCSGLRLAARDGREYSCRVEPAKDARNVSYAVQRTNAGSPDARRRERRRCRHREYTTRLATRLPRTRPVHPLADVLADASPTMKTAPKANAKPTTSCITLMFLRRLIAS